MVVVLEEVAHEPLALALLLEREPERDRVERAPGERVDEEEGDLGRARERGEERGDEGVDEDEEGRKVAGAVSESVRRRQRTGRKQLRDDREERDAPEGVKVLEDEEVLVEVLVVEVVPRRGGHVLVLVLDTLRLRHRREDRARRRERARLLLLLRVLEAEEGRVRRRRRRRVVLGVGLVLGVGRRR